MTKIVFKTKPRIGIDASEKLIERVSQNIQEVKTETKENILIKVDEKDPKPYMRNKSFPFETIKEIDKRIEYYRYGELKRTITMDKNNYYIETSLPDDEEGILLCIRDSIQKHTNNHIIHGELINYNGKGILIIGKERSGKTSLLIRLLAEHHPTFIGDEMVMLCQQNTKFQGKYIPHHVFIRINDIIKVNLKKYLKEIKSTNCSQYMDQSRVERILMKGLYKINAGIVFSRKIFCSGLNVLQNSQSKIDYIIETEYKNTEFEIEQKLTSYSDIVKEHFINMALLYENCDENYKSNINLYNTPIETLKISFRDAWEIPLDKLEEIIM